MCSFESIVKEITELTGIPEDIVKERVWEEALNLVINVVKSAKDYGVTPHVYDEKMEKFYKESDAFIFELMVESCRIGKRKVLQRTKERIERYIVHRNLKQINVLMFGDGVGSDSIFIYENFSEKAKIFYFDIPSSKTYEFAIKRFLKRRMKISIINNENDIKDNFYDIVICFEVLEHLPDPISLIKKINNSLKEGGIALITESFSSASPNFPTHLKSNLKYVFKTPYLFLKEKLYLTYYPKEDPISRPMEFEKKSNISFKEKLYFYKRKDLMLPRVKRMIKHMIKNTI